MIFFSLLLSNRGWQPRSSWTSTWRRTPSSSWTRRPARTRASSRWKQISNLQNVLHFSCRWTSRSLRTLWKTGWSNMWRCNTPGTRRRLKSKLISWNLLIISQLSFRFHSYKVPSTSLKSKCNSGDRVSEIDANSGFWQSMGWWVAEWEQPWQTWRMSQLTSGPTSWQTFWSIQIFPIPFLIFKYNF